MKKEINKECSKTYKINMNIKTYGECSVYGFSMIRFFAGLFKKRKGWRGVLIDVSNLDISEEEQ